MKRTQLQRGTVPLSRRTPLRAKRLPQPELRRRALVRAAVFARDGHQCRLADVAGAGPCWGGLTYQHRRKAGQGGPYTVENGATLCAHHNTQLEADADLARLGVQLGLVLRW